MQAQTNQIVVAHFRVPITKDMLNHAQLIPKHMVIPGEKKFYLVSSLETTQIDYGMAIFVSMKDCCTKQELWKKMSETSSIDSKNDDIIAEIDGTPDRASDSLSNIFLSQLGQRNSIVRLSKNAKSLNEKVLSPIEKRKWMLKSSTKDQCLIIQYVPKMIW